MTSFALPVLQPSAQRRGFVVWLTGLSGAGKSTLARALSKRLHDRGHRVEVLDGDEVRANLCQELGFSRQDRDTNVARIGYVASKLARHGVVVVVAAISPYQAARDAVRADIENFVEVYVDAPLATVVGRDVKGLYQRALRGEIAHFTGVSDPYERPRSPELTVHTAEQEVESCVRELVTYLDARGLSSDDRQHPVEHTPTTPLSSTQDTAQPTLLPPPVGDDGLAATAGAAPVFVDELFAVPVYSNDEEEQVAARLGALGYIE